MPSLAAADGPALAPPRYPPLGATPAERRALTAWLMALAQRRSLPAPRLSLRAWRDLPALAEGHGLSTLLEASAVELAMADLPSQLGRSVLEALDDAAARCRARDRVLAVEARSLAEALSEAGITWSFLKGAWLAADCYPWPASRPRADIDLWVPAAEQDEAGRVLRALGYRIESRSWKHTLWSRPDNRAVLDYRGEHAGNPRPVELHARMREAFRGIELDLTAAFVEQADEFGRDLLRFQHLCAHCTVDLLSRRLRAVQLIDIARLADRFQGEPWRRWVVAGVQPGQARFLWPAMVLARREAGAKISDAQLAALGAELEPALRRWVEAQDLDALSRFGRRDRRRDLLEVPRIWPETRRERLAVWHYILWPGRWQLADRHPRLAGSRLWPLMYPAHAVYSLRRLGHRWSLRSGRRD